MSVPRRGFSQGRHSAIKLDGGPDIGERFVGFVRKERDTEIPTQRPELEISRGGEVMALVKQPLGALHCAEHPIMARKENAAPLKPRLQERPVKVCVVGGELGHGEGRAIACASLQRGMPAQKLGIFSAPRQLPSVLRPATSPDSSGSSSESADQPDAGQT